MINKGRQKTKQILGPKYKKTGFPHSHQMPMAKPQHTHKKTQVLRLHPVKQHPVRSTGWGWGFYHPHSDGCINSWDFYHPKKPHSSQSINPCCSVSPARRVAAKDQPWDCKAKLLGTVAEPRKFIAATDVSKVVEKTRHLFPTHTARLPRPLPTHEITEESFESIVQWDCR